jgi:cytochrome P450
MMRPQFARDQISDLGAEERHVQNMMSTLDLSMQSDGWTGPVDLQVLFLRLSFDAATEFLIGQSVDCQTRLLPTYKPTKEDAMASEFASALDTSLRGLASRARFGERYWVVNTKEFRDSCKLCHKYIDHFVQLALSKELRKKEHENGALFTKEKYVFLEALVGETQDPVELRYQLLSVLLAGRDTTASLMGWLFLSLARDPARYKKLRDVIVTEFGTYERPLEITFSKLKSCRYLQHCNNETLRLYPIVPINARYANKDTTLPRGGGNDRNSPIFVPKGTTVQYSVHVMHHRKDIWGADAEEFRPERWENRKAGWDYLPVSFVFCVFVLPDLTRSGLV